MKNEFSLDKLKKYDIIELILTKNKRMTREYITKKEDLKDIYIKIPNNLSKKKWDKIKLKLERLGFKDFEYFKYIYAVNYDNQCLFIWEDGSIGIWCENFALEQMENPKVISIKDFLAEPKKEETISIFANGIEYIFPKEYQFLRGTILSNNEPSICEYCGKEIYLEIAKAKGFEPGEFVCPNCLNKKELKKDIQEEFENGLEALNWCIKNPMSIVAFSYDENEYIREFVRYNDKLRDFQIETVITNWEHLYGDVLIKLIKEYKKTRISTIVCPYYAEY